MLSKMANLLGIFLLVAHLMACGGGGGDGGGGGGDVTRPTVISTNPANNSVAVETDRAITATFNEAIDPATIDASSFGVVSNGLAVTGSVNYNVASRTATFNGGALAPQTTYVATITTAVRDLAGNSLAVDHTWQFTTGDAPDATPPTVWKTIPAPNALSVAPNTTISVTFSEAIAPATINASSFVVVGNGLGVTGSVTYDVASRTATFNGGALAPQTTYAATITTAVKDMAGNSLAADYTWQFTTGDASDATPPTVQMTFPAANALSVAPNTAISVTFSESIAPTTVNTQTLVLKKDGVTPVAGVVTYVGTTATFTPTADLSANASYTASVTTGIKDLAGNALSATFTWDFSTGSQNDLQGPQVLSVSPVNGASNVPIDTPLEVTFNEPIMPFDLGLIDGRPVTVTFNPTYTIVTMIPTEGLEPGKTYTAMISVPDQAGNAMEEVFAWTFSTQP